MESQHDGDGDAELDEGMESEMEVDDDVIMEIHSESEVRAETNGLSCLSAIIMVIWCWGHFCVTFL